MTKTSWLKPRGKSTKLSCNWLSECGSSVNKRAPHSLEEQAQNLTLALMASMTWFTASSALSSCSPCLCLPYSAAVVFAASWRVCTEWPFLPPLHTCSNLFLTVHSLCGTLTRKAAVKSSPQPLLERSHLNWKLTFICGARSLSPPSPCHKAVSSLRTGTRPGLFCSWFSFSHYCCHGNTVFK